MSAALKSVLRTTHSLRRKLPSTAVTSARFFTAQQNSTAPINIKSTMEKTITTSAVFSPNEVLNHPADIPINVVSDVQIQGPLYKSSKSDKSENWIPVLSSENGNVRQMYDEAE